MIKFNKNLLQKIRRFVTRKYAQQYSDNFEKPRYNILPKIQREINEKMWAELYAPQMIPLVDLVDFKKINSMNTNMTVMENLDQTALRRVSKYYRAHGGDGGGKHMSGSRKGNNNVHLDEEDDVEEQEDVVEEMNAARGMLDEGEIDDSPLGNFAAMFDNNEMEDMEAEMEAEYADMDGSGYSDENNDDDNDDLDDLMAEYEFEDVEDQDSD